MLAVIIIAFFVLFVSFSSGYARDSNLIKSVEKIKPVKPIDSRLQLETTTSTAVNIPGFEKTNTVFFYTGIKKIAEKTNGVLSYAHDDNVGNLILKTDSLGNEQPGSRVSYDAFGSADSDDASYTGHLLDNGIGMYYMKSRYYDPDIGRFISADSVPGDITDPQSLNRYIYVTNRPTINIDPNGKQQFPSNIIITGADSVEQVMIRGSLYSVPDSFFSPTSPTPDTIYLHVSDSLGGGATFTTAGSYGQFTDSASILRDFLFNEIIDTSVVIPLSVPYVIDTTKEVGAEGERFLVHELYAHFGDKPSTDTLHTEVKSAMAYIDANNFISSDSLARDSLRQAILVIYDDLHTDEAKAYDKERNFAIYQFNQGRIDSTTLSRVLRETAFDSAATVNRADSLGNYWFNQIPY